MMMPGQIHAHIAPYPVPDSPWQRIELTFGIADDAVIDALGIGGFHHLVIECVTGYELTEIVYVPKSCFRPPSNSGLKLPVSSRPNRFADVPTIAQVVGQAVGAGSTCWVGGTGDAQFDSNEALVIVSEATERIQQLGEQMFGWTGAL